MRPPRRHRPTTPCLHLLFLEFLLALLCPAVLKTAAAAPRTGSTSTGGGGGVAGVSGTMAWVPWPQKCTWLPLPTSGKSHTYTLVSKYHKIWKATKDVVSAKDGMRKEPVSGVIALKESMKYFDADFFNDSKLREMEEGAKEFNVPAFRENRRLVALENGGLHNPSVLLFKSSCHGNSRVRETKNFNYPHTSVVHRPSNDEDIAFMSIIELGELIRTKQITSRELTDIFLRRLKRYSPVLQSTVTYTEDLAYKQAKAADDLLEQGKYLGM